MWSVTRPFTSLTFLMTTATWILVNVMPNAALSLTWFQFPSVQNPLASRQVTLTAVEEGVNRESGRSLQPPLPLRP
jgi:hypothetical protein